MVVILTAVLLEVRGEVQQRLGECPTKYEHQRDEQSTDPAVAVEKGMDDLELVVGQGKLDKQWEVPLVEEAFEVAERGAHLVGWRRDEYRVFERAPADPHRTRAQLAGETVLAANAGEEPFVHLAEQPNRHGEAFAYAPDAVLHRTHVVLYLLRVFGLLRRRVLAGLEAKELLDIGLGPFDPGTEHRLEPQVRPNEEMRVGDQTTHTAEPVDGAGRLIQQVHYLL